MREVETFIPHREPFRFVDEVISADAEGCTGFKDFGQGRDYLNVMDPGYKVIPGPILVEALAQCGGAGVCKAGLTEPGVYAFASMESAVFHKNVPAREMVKLVIKNHRAGHKFIKQTGYAYVNDELVAEATWLCARI